MMLITTTVALLLMLAGAPGCTSNSKETETAAAPRELHLPADAQMVVSGAGNSELSFKASEDGRVWVMDETANRVLTRHRLRAGQRFMLSPSADAATVDGRPVTDMQRLRLDPGHQYRLYFERE